MNTYLLLELCHNESIKHMLDRRQSHRLTEPEAKYYLKQLVGALKYLHDERYVVHRDVKPANLLLDKNMQLKLADFGLAKELQATQTNGGRTTIVKGGSGSPAYMAPESIKTKGGRANRHLPSFEIDVWSVGVVSFSSLVGRTPFVNAGDVDATYQRILDNDYEFPEGIDISKDARDLIDRLLRTDPSDR
jgi:serine/threonine protein kinase